MSDLSTLLDSFEPDDSGYTKFLTRDAIALVREATLMRKVREWAVREREILKRQPEPPGTATKQARLNRERERSTWFPVCPQCGYWVSPLSRGG